MCVANEWYIRQTCLCNNDNNNSSVSLLMYICVYVYVSQMILYEIYYDILTQENTYILRVHINIIMLKFIVLTYVDFLMYAIYSYYSLSCLLPRRTTDDRIFYEEQNVHMKWVASVCKCLPLSILVYHSIYFI